MTQFIMGIIFDIDGTLLRGSFILPAALKTIQQLRARKIKVCFFTNDNRTSVDKWLERLRAQGIAINADEMITSAIVAAETVAHSHPTGNVLVVGDVGLQEAFQAQNLHLIDWDCKGPADIVVMGKDPHFDQNRLNIVCQHIWNGAKFVATNNDHKMPVADGYVPGTGAMVQAVAYATGVQPLVTGKPSIHAAKIALSRMGVQANQAAIVGDSLTSDIQLGKTANMISVLTLTGTHSRTDAARLPIAAQPDHIIQDLSELIPTLFGEKPS